MKPAKAFDAVVGVLIIAGVVLLVVAAVLGLRGTP